MSGVFGRTAIITSLVDFAEDIPEVYGKYFFNGVPDDRTVKEFLPPVSFISIAQTKETASRLTALHEQYGVARRREHSSEHAASLFARRRVELPPV
jgi:hypothetical protein